MNLSHESIRAVADKEYDYNIIKDRYQVSINGYQYWFREQNGNWEFCGKVVKTWLEVFEIIHKSGILIGEGRMLAIGAEKAKELETYYHKRAANWLKEDSNESARSDSKRNCSDNEDENGRSKERT